MLNNTLRSKVATLTKRTRSANRIGDEGACALGDALKTNTTLTVLGLFGEQQDHKEAQQENEANTMAREVTEQAAGSK